MTRVAWILAATSLLSVGCAPDLGTPADEPNDEPPGFEPPAPPAHGTQLVLDSFVLEPGEEVERCRTMKAPNLEAGEVISVQLSGRPGLHHTVVYTVDSPQDDWDEPCFGFPDELMSGFNVPRPLFASTSQVYDETLDMPDGVGIGFGAEQQILFNYHYINVTSEPLEAEIYLNLEFAEEGAELEPAQFYAFGNIGGIDVPAGMTQRLTTTCPFPQDVNLFSLTPHMHKLGRGFEARLHDGAAPGEVLLESSGWENAESAYLDPPRAMTAGEGLTFTCEWTNDTDSDVAFGQEFDDEMCFVFGFAYPATSPIYGFDYDGSCTTEESTIE